MVLRFLHFWSPRLQERSAHLILGGSPSTLGQTYDCSGLDKRFKAKRGLQLDSALGPSTRNGYRHVNNTRGMNWRAEVESWWYHAAPRKRNRSIDSLYKDANTNSNEGKTNANRTRVEL